MLHGEYYLVARNVENNQVTRIPLDTSWYTKENDGDKIYGCSLPFIDNMTVRFKSKEEFAKRLFSNGYIDNVDVDIYIAHLHKFNRKYYITKHEVLYNTSERVRSIVELSSQMIDKSKIDAEVVDILMNKLITKNHYDVVFHELMTCPWSKIDKYVSEQLVKNQHLKKVDYSLKYKISDKLNEYLVLRNIVYMWNLYEELLLNNKELVIGAGLRELSVKFTSDYINMLEETDSRKECDDALISRVAKSYIEGQYTIFDYLDPEDYNLSRKQ